MVLTYLRLLLKPRNYFFWLNSYASHLLTALVLCNCHVVVLSYLKLPFEPCSSRLLCSLQTTTHQLGTTWLCSIPAFIKVSLGADSSSLKVVGLHTMVQNTASAHSLFKSHGDPQLSYQYWGLFKLSKLWW